MTEVPGPEVVDGMLVSCGGDIDATYTGTPFSVEWTMPALPAVDMVATDEIAAAPADPVDVGYGI